MTLFKLIKQNPLASILIFGFILRLIFSLTSDHIYYGDEIFQSLEPGFNLANGYGMISWEWREGIRSYIVPAMVATALIPLKFFKITDPNIYIPVVKILFSAISISLIYSIYLITKALTRSQKLALTTAFISATWYEFIYMAPRPLSGIISTYFILLGFGLLINNRKEIPFIKGDRRRSQPSGFKKGSINEIVNQIIIGILLATGLYIRIMYILIFPLFLLIYFKVNKTKIQSFWSSILGGTKKSRTTIQKIFIKNKITIFSFIFTTIIAGFIDYLSWGSWGYSNIHYFQMFGDGIAELFGTHPWNYYLSSIIFSSVGLIAFLYFLPDKYRYILWHLITFVAVFSYLPHKEYRFIFIIIPLLLILITISMYHIYKRPGGSPYRKIIIIFTIASLASILGLTKKVAIAFNTDFQNAIYQRDFFQKDATLQYYKSLFSQDICGIFDATRYWVQSGGYYYIGKHIQVYDYYQQPQDLNYINSIITQNRQAVPEYSYQKTFQTNNHNGNIVANVYSRDGDCQIDPAYTNNRYIPNEETALNNPKKHLQ